VTPAGQQISIEAGGEAPDKIASVIELEVDGPLRAVKPGM
jgi:hypothetical protein